MRWASSLHDALSRLDYHAVLDKAPILYLIGMLALVAVLAVGHTRFGAKRWLPVLGQFFQVSELAKLIIIVSLARFFADVRTDRLSLADLFKAAVLTAVPVGLILLQPDLGTAMVLVPVVVVGAYLAGIQWKHAAVMLLAGRMMLPVAWHVLKPYQKERVTTFLRPEDDPKGSGYQILQSKIAVGSGGFWGKGLGNGSQNQLGFVPVRYSDFILAALAEELGFAGVFVALVLYTALLLRLIQNAQRAKDRAGMFLVMGVAAILGFPRAGERGHGHWLHAGDRHSAAADELRRFGHVIRVFGAGLGDERPLAAIRQLSPQPVGYSRAGAMESARRTK